MVTQDKTENPEIKWSEFLKGSKDAFTWIYNRYTQDLFRYGMRFTPNRELVKDAIQEIFTNIYKTRPHLSIPTNVKVYLFVALKNQLLRTMQKEVIYDSMLQESMPFMLEPTVEEELIEKEHQSLQKEQIGEVLSLLTPRQQEIIYYRFVQEMNFEEIGILMNLNYQSAQNLIQRSLKKIRNFYGVNSPTLYLLLFFIR
jgi:RNA polymerase sigma factor (sigma-70 family)